MAYEKHHNESLSMFSESKDGNDMDIEGDIAVDSRRFYVSFMLCLVSFQQGLVWNQISALASTSESILSDEEIALGPDMGALAVLPAGMMNQS